MGQIEMGLRNRLSEMEAKYHQQVGASEAISKRWKEAAREAHGLQKKLDKADVRLSEAHDLLETILIHNWQEVDHEIRELCGELGLDLEWIREESDRRMA